MSAAPNMRGAPSAPATTIDDAPEMAEQTPLWREEQQTPETELLRERDASVIRRMVDALAEPFKETFVLREINNLSYREIADAVGATGRHCDVPSRAGPRHAALGMAGGTGASQMNCDEAEILIHALIDNELDASHAREVEAHIATCPRCTAELAAYRQMREAMTKADLRYTAAGEPAPAPRRGAAETPRPRHRTWCR